MAERQIEKPKGMHRHGNGYTYKKMIEGRKVRVALPSDFLQAVAKARALNALFEADRDEFFRQLDSKSETIKYTLPMLFAAGNRGRDITESSVSRYRVAEERLIQYGLDHNCIDAAAWTHDTALDYVASLRKKYAKGTVVTDVGYIKGIFEVARRRKMIEDNPFDQLMIKRKTTQEIADCHHIVYPADWPKLIEAARRQNIGRVPYDFGDVVEFVLHSGLRDDELRTLEWSDWIKSADHLRVRPKTRKDGVSFSPKGTSGDIPLNDVTRGILERLEQTKISDFIFPHEDGAKNKIRFLRKIKATAKAAGLDSKMRFHDLRHSFGAALRRKGVALETIKELMRHATLDQTLQYAIYSVEEGQNAIQKLV